MKRKLLLLGASLLLNTGLIKAQFSPYNRGINIQLDTTLTYSYASQQGTTSFLDSKPGISATQFFPYPKSYMARALFAATATADAQFSLASPSAILTMKNSKNALIKSSFYNIQNAAAIAKFAFDLDLTNYTGAATFVIAIGNSSVANGTLRLINANASYAASNTDVFGAFRVANGGSIGRTQYKNAAGGDVLLTAVESLIKVGASQHVEIYVNSTSGSTSYTHSSSPNPITLAANTYHVYVGGTRYGTDFPKNGSLYEGTTINGITFQFDSNATQETVSISNLSVTYPSTTDPTLPVSLTTFTGKKTANGVILNWATASEQHNDYFEITRSTDGKVFIPIGTVKGKGTTNQISHYTLTDNVPALSTNYYQLKQYDQDGSLNTYQETVAVDYALNQERFAVYAIENKLNVSVYSNVEGWGELMIFDLRGEKLMLTKIQLKAGENTIAVDAGKLTNGLLIARLTGANLNKATKFIK